MEFAERQLIEAEARHLWAHARRAAARLVHQKKWEPVLAHAERVLTWSIHGPRCDHPAVRTNYEHTAWVARCSRCDAIATAADKDTATDLLVDDADQDRGAGCVHAARVLADLSRCHEAPYDDVASVYILAMNALTAEWPKQLLQHQEWMPFLPDQRRPSEVFPGGLDAKGKVVLYLTPLGMTKLREDARVALPPPR